MLKSRLLLIASIVAVAATLTVPAVRAQQTSNSCKLGCVGMEVFDLNYSGPSGPLGGGGLSLTLDINNGWCKKKLGTANKCVVESACYATIIVDGSGFPGATPINVTAHRPIGSVTVPGFANAAGNFLYSSGWIVHCGSETSASATAQIGETHLTVKANGSCTKCK